jgi:hypothetical protein
MGEVYRARDARLGREVAIKVLPAEVAENAERLNRFEREARSASSLNHHNIVTVFDIGTTEGVSWIAMERIDGETLRKLLLGGPLPLKKLLAIGGQMADGLAKAHETGIVHRDLKPENVMVTREGIVKILDFGLAKLTTASGETGEATQSPTVSAATEAGVLLGTVGYMSPEQALGDPLDFRSDQFSLGAILYEMVSGRRAFARKSAPETLTAIIREEPEPLATAAPESPVPLRWMLERCLAKDREERYESTRDLARDLARLRDGLTDGSLSWARAVAAVDAAPRRVAWLLPTLVAAAVLVGAATAYLAARRHRDEVPAYRLVSYHRGAIGGARFAPDEKTIVYAAAWQGAPPQLYSTRLDSTESTALALPSANLLSLSSSGKLAILLGRFPDNASIAEVSLAGGAPRPLFEGEPTTLMRSQSVADWEPGQDRLAIVRNGQLEFPPGRVLVPAGNGARVLGLRFAPDGKRIGFIQDSPKGQAVGVVDLAGQKRILSSGWEIARSLAWHPRTGEIWFSARSLAASTGVIELYAVSLSGDQRIVARSPQLIIVQDIARDGRVLARSEEWTESTTCLPPGGSRELDLTWLDFSEVMALSADGQDLVLVEGGAGAGATGGIYMRKTDGASPAVRLGNGWFAEDLSADKRWVLRGTPDQLTLLPVGPGETRTIQDPGFRYRNAAFLPDGKTLVIAAAAQGRRPSLYVRDLAAGPPRPFGPEGCRAPQVSPDGKTVAALCDEGKWLLLSPTGGEPRALDGVGGKPREIVLGFDDTGRNLWLASGAQTVRVERYEIATGRRSFFKDITVADPTGVEDVESVHVTPDGRAYCYSYMRSLSRLYVMDGLR